MKSINDIRVLVIDDSPRFLEQFEEMLNVVGIDKVKTCNSAQEAIDLLSNGAPILKEIDIIICDQHMDKCTGIDILKILRVHKTKEQMPFFLITSDATKPNIIMMAQSGGNNFIAKPPVPDDIAKKIRDVFGLANE